MDISDERERTGVMTGHVLTMFIACNVTQIQPNMVRFHHGENEGVIENE